MRYSGVSKDGRRVRRVALWIIVAALGLVARPRVGATQNRQHTPDAVLSAAPPPFERFNPGGCLQAPKMIARLETRASPETAAYTPARNRVSRLVRDSVRVCTQRYATRVVPRIEQLNIARAQLLLGDDAGAEATAQRYLETVGTTAVAPRAWALSLLVEDLARAAPPRLPAALRRMAELDALPPPAAAKAQLLAHVVLAQVAKEQFDDALATGQASAAIAAWQQLPDLEYRVA